jgi:rhamnogalacturonyl hydrolase YesR
MNLSNSECRRRALLAADWFVNTQVVQEKPRWDANHGRVVYNYHMPSGRRVHGLSWSQGRAIMCLAGAWQATGRQSYLDAAVRCGDYLRYALQSHDQRNPKAFGSLREEVPTSRFCYPRDGIEGAFGLLLLYLMTCDADYRDCCELFADWYIRHAYVARDGWVHGRVGFDDDEDKVGYSYIQAGGAPFFWHLYQLTGTKRYLTMVRALADGMIERFIDSQTGAIVADKVGGHHAVKLAGRPVVFNDDGSSIALTIAHVALGRGVEKISRTRAGSTRDRNNSAVQRKSKYLDAAIRYGDWIINDCPRPTGRFVASAMQSVFLTELAAVAGVAKYAAFARVLMADQVKLQVLVPGKPDRHGGYRGEDENPDWYVPGTKARDFLTTRTTAYSTLSLLRLAGLSHGPSYSALGLEELMTRPSAKCQVPNESA